MLREGQKWSGWSPTWMLGHRIGGKRLGILGMGRIGTAVARRARPFGLSIHYHNRRPVEARVEEELEATYWDSLDQMLARIDILSVNCPATPATFHLLSRAPAEADAPRRRHREHRARLHHRRGGADRRRWRTGALAGAGLDVFEHEPAVDPQLIKLAKAGKVVLLPHMGSATLEGRVDMGETVIINIRTWMDGHKPPDRVLPSFASRKLCTTASRRPVHSRASPSLTRTPPSERPSRATTLSFRP